MTNKSLDSLKIVGINLVVMAAYTVMCRFGMGGSLLDAILLLLHVSFCLIYALRDKSWIWLLSALMVLLIGMSTCVNYIHM